MAPRKGKTQKTEEQVTLGPQVKEGENVFGVAHIFASFNDTFVHVTDLSGKWVNKVINLYLTGWSLRVLYHKEYSVYESNRMSQRPLILILLESTDLGWQENVLW